jgi:hypothetical protein
MTFWPNTWSNVLGGIGAGLFFLLCYMIVQWFLRATDLLIGYSWQYKTVGGTVYFWPAFDIRNRSRSVAYRLGNIAYTVNGTTHSFDNDSVKHIVLEPASINDIEVGPVRDVHTIQDALKIEVTLRDQLGRSFWLRGQGPGQQGKSRVRRAAFWLRAKLERMLIPLE